MQFPRNIVVSPSVSVSNSSLGLVLRLILILALVLVLSLLSICLCLWHAPLYLIPNRSIGATPPVPSSTLYKTPEISTHMRQHISPATGHTIPHRFVSQSDSQRHR